MANTLKKIQTITVGSGGAASIEFTSIPATYTDLKIVLSARSLQGNVYGGGALQFNSDTGSNYKWRRIRADGSTSASDNSTSATAITNWDVAGANATASVFGSVEIYIPNYAGSNQKSVSLEYVGENNATESHMGMVAGLWTSTSAITSIKLFSSGNNYVQYTTATLYGISNANTTAGGSGKATGGNQVYTDGSYWYHVFTSDGNFVPTTSMNVDYLVVAGGGGGAAAIPSNNAGGGGGAGGLRCTVGATGGGGSLESALAVTAQTYAITIGAGGNGGAAGANNKGTVGSNSIFSSITSSGGGYGGAEGDSGGPGGSGGGSGRKTASQTGGAGTANQGYNGGDSVNSGNYPGGGGGGAGAVGANATTSNGGAGGAGISTSISGTSTSYGGGGGGGVYITGTPGAGGLGGGGAAGAAGLNAGNPGTANTGGGGGGASINSTAGGRAGGNGGSGIVIVRYAA